MPDPKLALDHLIAVAPSSCPRGAHILFQEPGVGGKGRRIEPEHVHLFIQLIPDEFVSGPGTNVYPRDTGMNSTVTTRVFIIRYSSELSVPVTCL